MTASVSYAALIMVEKNLTQELEKNMQIPVMQSYSDSLAVTAESSSTKVATFEYDPIAPTTDLPVWEKQNKYVNTMNGLRYGFGPELRRQVVRPEVRDTVRVLVVGDSWVWGFSVEDADSRWPALLEQQLNKDTRINYEVITLARSGASHMDMADWLTPKRIASLRPDVIAIGYLDNDVVPSYEEKALCKKFGTCVVEGSAMKTASQANLRRIRCLKGDSSLFSKVVEVLSSRFPQFAARAADRYCSAERFESEYVEENEFEIKKAPDKSEYWPLYTQSVRAIASSVGEIPTFLFPYSPENVNHPGVKLVLDTFRNSGIDVVLGERTTYVARTMSKADRSVNIIDGHPSRLQAMSYAADVAQHIRTLNLRQRPSQEPPKNPLISNYLPLDLYISPSNHERMSIRSALSSEPPTGSTLGMDIQAPCTVLGRPYARVMFDPVSRPSIVKRSLRVSIKVSGNRLLLPISHDVKGREIFGQPIMVSDEALVTLPEGTAGIMITGVRSGCGSANWELEPFALVVQKLDRTT